MVAKGEDSPSSDGESPKQYLVECDECSFEETATGRDEVNRIGNRHRTKTGHELVAIEYPHQTKRPEL